MEISDDVIRSLMVSLERARDRKDEAGAVLVAMDVLDRLGIPDDLLDPLDAVFKRLMTERAKKLFGNRSLPPHVVFRRGMDAAKVIVMTRFGGFATQGDALKKLGLAGNDAKEISDFIDNWQRGRLNKLAKGYLEHAIDYVLMEWTPPERREELAKAMLRIRENIRKADM